MYMVPVHTHQIHNNVQHRLLGSAFSAVWVEPCRSCTFIYTSLEVDTHTRGGPTATVVAWGMVCYKVRQGKGREGTGRWGKVSWRMWTGGMAWGVWLRMHRGGGGG